MGATVARDAMAASAVARASELLRGDNDAPRPIPLSEAAGSKRGFLRGVLSLGLLGC